MESDRVAELAKQISDFVNGFGMGRSQALAVEMVRDHPTLQQGKMRLFVAFVREMAKIEYTDARNENSVALAKLIVKTIDDSNIGLPTI
jgi:hypothetical protein